MSQWYITQTERKATLTDFSLASRCSFNGVYEAGNYYLRSTGSSASNVCCVYCTGYTIIDFYTATYDTLGVRHTFHFIGSKYFIFIWLCGIMK